MRRSSFLLLAFFPIAVQAQVALTLRGVWTHPHPSFRVTSPDVTPSVDASFGPGVAATWHFSPALSAELGASRSKGDFSVSGFGLGSLDMTPVTAALQFHVAPRGVADVYAGGGAAYAAFKSATNGRAFDLFGYQSLDFGNKVGWLVNGGTNLRFGRRWGLNFDAKYMRFNVSTAARRLDGTRTDPTTLRLSPLQLAAGVTFNF